MWLASQNTGQIFKEGVIESKPERNLVRFRPSAVCISPEVWKCSFDILSEGSVWSGQERR